MRYSMRHFQTHCAFSLVPAVVIITVYQISADVAHSSWSRGAVDNIIRRLINYTLSV